MKQYFAKYLPVEGKIKEGDMTLHPIKGLYKAVVDGAYTNQKLVKLFLCSRDIQVGDKVKINSDRDWLDVEVVTIPRDPHVISYGVKSDSFWGNYSEVFKVIGEISPAANWIKEGDEFDKDSLCLLGKNITIFFSWSGNPEDIKNCYVAVKCPTCKNFH